MASRVAVPVLLFALLAVLLAGTATAAPSARLPLAALTAAPGPASALDLPTGDESPADCDLDDPAPTVDERPALAAPLARPAPPPHPRRCAPEAAPPTRSAHAGSASSPRAPPALALS